MSSGAQENPSFSGVEELSGLSTALTLGPVPGGQPPPELPSVHKLSSVTLYMTGRGQDSVSFWGPFLQNSAPAQVWAVRNQDLPCIFPDGYGEQGKKDFEENRGQAVTSPEL